MKHTLLFSALLALLVPAAMPAHAQEGGGVDTRKANTRASHKADQAKQSAATNEAPLYPQATRTSPEQKGDKALQKDMESLRKLQEEDNAEDKTIALADSILANPKANAYDKSSAAYIAGNAWRSKDTDSYANAIKYYKMAIDFNGLHNNNHYNAMFGTAQMLDAEGKQAEALQMIDRFVAETKDEGKALGVKAQILNGMDKPAEAAAILEKQLAANPNDKKTMLNAAALYQQADQDAKAVAIFDKMRAQGMLTESRDYEVGVSLLAHVEGRQKDALALMDEGLKKGILQPSYNTYLMQGQAFYEADDMPHAIEAWTKGAPLSKDGEMWLNVAKLNNDQEKWAAAKEAAQQAKAKGVKKPGDVYQAIALAENGLGNKAAAKAAVQEAAKHAETKNWAEAQLRQGFAK
jgi:hypothetical protein